MKKAICTLFLASLSSLFLSLHAAVIPKDVLKAASTLVKVTTYSASGKPITTSNGFLLSNGNAVSEYTAFRPAVKASVSGKGVSATVERICGANDLYNIVAFSLGSSTRKGLSPSTEKTNTGSTVYIIANNGNKSHIEETTVKEIQPISGGKYFTLARAFNPALVGCPVVDKMGNLVAIIQPNAKTSDHNTYAVDGNLAFSLRVTALDFNNIALHSIQMPKQLPQSEKEASTYLFLLSQSGTDSLTLATALNDFIAAFPNNSEGYQEKAKFLAGKGLFAEAENSINQAISTSEQKDSPHFLFSQLLYNQALRGNNSYPSWNLERALSEAQTAYGIKQLPLYKLQEGNCLFGLQKWQEAYDAFSSVCNSSLASAETFFYAARAKEKMQAPDGEIIVLLDSAISRFSKPYGKQAAPYFWERAKYEYKAKKFREAVLDLDEYEHIIGFNNLNDQFYYMREQAAIACNYYPKAVDDINRAIAMQPDNYLYNIEKAALMIRVGQFDEAITTAKKSISLEPNESDGYKMLGIAYGETKQKKLAVQNLQKAKELGDNQVSELIKAYNK